MTVSVIIAVYNGAGHLARAVASVQAQTHDDWEIVIADDRSTDDTCAVVEAMAAGDGRIRLLRADRNGGPSAARNRAIAAARGEWIAVLDADDAFRPTRLADMLAAAERSGASVVVDNLLLFDGAANREDGPALSGDTGEHPLDAVTILRAERPWPGPRLGFLKPMIRTALIRDNGLEYPESLRHSEDLVLLVEAILAGGGATMLRKPGYIYTRPVPRPRAPADADRSGLVAEQRAAAGRMLLERQGGHPDRRVRHAVADYAAWTRDIARGRAAIAGLRARRPLAAFQAGPRAMFRYLVTVPRVKRLLTGAGLARGSIG